MQDNFCFFSFHFTATMQGKGWPAQLQENENDQKNAKDISYTTNIGTYYRSQLLKTVIGLCNSKDLIVNACYLIS